MLKTFAASAAFTMQFFGENSAYSEICNGLLAMGDMTQLGPFLFVSCR
jgi:hypothetical protein